jgi:hypothetical protein
MGSHVANVEESIKKTRINSSGAALPDDTSPVTVDLIRS